MLNLCTHKKSYVKSNIFLLRPLLLYMASPPFIPLKSYVLKFNNKNVMHYLHNYKNMCTNNIQCNIYYLDHFHLTMTTICLKSTLHSVIFGQHPFFFYTFLSFFFQYFQDSNQNSSHILGKQIYSLPKSVVI